MKVRKILSVILAVTMIMGTLGTVAFAEETAVATACSCTTSTVWDGTVCTDWYDVSGQTTSYDISTPAQLAGIADLVNNSNVSFKNITINLMDDIDLNGSAYAWTPIGTTGDKSGFCGTFNGNGKAINNLTVTLDTMGYHSAGLFGSATNAIIKNFTMNNVNITNYDVVDASTNGSAAVVGSSQHSSTIDNVHVSDVTINSNRYSAGIAGYFAGTISNCSVTNIKIVATPNSNGSTYDNGDKIGGIVGFLNSGNNSITKCTVTNADLTGYRDIGGIVGCGQENANISENTVDGEIVITVDQTTNSYGEKAANAGIYIGRENKSVVDEVVVGPTADVTVSVTDSNGNTTVEEHKTICKIGEKGYFSLDDAILAADESSDGVIELSAGEFTLGTVTLPTDLTNVTFKGADNKGTVIKDSAIVTKNGKHIYENITFDGIVFDNTDILVVCWNAGSSLKNWTINNCEFLNIVQTDTSPAVSFNIGNLGTVELEDFTFTNNIIDGISGGQNSAVNVLAIAGEYNIANNVIKNVPWNAFQFQNAAKNAVLNLTDNTVICSSTSGPVFNINQFKGAVVATGNDITLGRDGQKVFGNISTGIYADDTNVVRDVNGNEVSITAQFKAAINGVNYTSLDAAIAAAADGDIITILPGTYDAFVVPETKNDLTFVGTTDDEGNNLVTIRTLEDSVPSPTKGVYVKGKKVAFKNIDFTAGSKTSVWVSASIGNTNNEVSMGTSYLESLTVENCNFAGSGAGAAIWVRVGDVTVINCTFDGYEKGVDNYCIRDGQTVSITDSIFTNINNAIHTGEAQTGSQIVVTDSVIDTNVIHVGGSVDMSISNTEIKDVDIETFSDVSLAVSDSALYSTTFKTNHNSSIAIDRVYVDNVNEIAYSTKTNNIDFNTYYPTIEDFEYQRNLLAVPNVADALYVEFEDVTATDAEGEKVYNINLVAPTSQTINRLNSVDLEFILNNDNGSNEYEIIASNDEVTINNVEGNRYEFHYADKDDDVDTDTAASITIGQVKFTGYGQFDFAVKSNDTNVAHATTIGDNMVDTYLPNGDETTVAEGELVISDDTVTDVVIEVPTRALEVEIDFNNAVNKQVADYQDMTVIVSGGDLPANIEIELGKENYTEDVEIFGKSKAKYTVDTSADNKYVVTVAGALTVDTTYTVTVSGAGYRTVRKNITMNEDATVDNVLTYWNNVKDADGADYLAGDIVKDNTINIYDLSAVVSYFGRTNNTSAYSKYARYDLNRDGKIDSKDVAYVLVSWGK